MRAWVHLLALAGTAAAQEPAWIVAPHDPPAIARLAVDGARDARIEALIDDLRVATSLSGSKAANELVRLGPAAIPLLLRHLDDERETGLEIRSTAFATALAHAEVPVPPGRSEERASMLAALEDDTLVRWSKVDTGEGIRGHVATVGDFCFAILGRIVNRPYEPVRSPTSRLTIVSSPTLDPKVATAVHGWWGRGEPRQLHFRSLLDDFHTRGKASTAFQAAAGARLLADYPDESAAIVRGRLRELRWTVLERDETDSGMLLSALLATGHPSVRAEWLGLLDPERPPAVQRAALDAAAKFDAEAQARVRAIAMSTDDIDILARCLVAVPGVSSPEFLARLGEDLGRQRDPGLLLDAIAATGDTEGVAILRRYIEGSPETRGARVLSALDRFPGAVLVLALAPPYLGATGPVPPRDGMRMPEWVKAARTCDWAASLIAKARPELSFDPKAEVPERDRQIAAIRAALAK